MYVYEEFPKYKFHPSKEPVIVKDADEEAALSDDWFDRPDQAAAALARLHTEVKRAQHDRK